jgi:hypothetical protein
MKWSLQCDEASLRDVFRSLGGEAAHLMLDAVEGGVRIEVKSGMNSRQITDRAAALALLEEKFGWTPAQEQQMGNDAGAPGAPD